MLASVIAAPLYAAGYSWQGAWQSPTMIRAASPEECRSLAAGADNWSFRHGEHLGCTYGTIVAGGCAAKVDGWDSDSSALNSPCLESNACKLPTFSGNLCNSSLECLPTCCYKSNCTTSGCSTGEQCLDSKCCGGDGCLPDPAHECISGVCKNVGMLAFSCDMNAPFMPNTTQRRRLETVCTNKPLGENCSAAFGKLGNLTGRCLINESVLSCYPPRVCWAVNGKTSLSAPTGYCQSICTTMGICDPNN